MRSPAPRDEEVKARTAAPLTPDLHTGGVRLEDPMNRLRIVLAFVLIIALAVPALARGPNQPNPPGKAYGFYGCMCPFTAEPVTPGAYKRLLVTDFGYTPAEAAEFFNTFRDVLCDPTMPWR